MRVFSFFISLIVLPLISWGQASSSLLIPVNKQTFQSLGGQSAQIDLIKEIKKLKPALSAGNIEIQMVRLGAKANVGGGLIVLKINNASVASVVIDTNPELFNSADSRSFEKFELKNIDRARISSASLQIRDRSIVKMNNVEVILGSIQEPVIFGKYASDQASAVGGVITDTRPSQQTANTITSNYFNFGDTATVMTSQPKPVTQPKPVVVTKTTVAKPVVQPTPRRVPSGCVRDHHGDLICVGDIVVNRYGYEQEVVAVNTRNRTVLLYCPDIADEPYAQHVDRL